MWLTLLSVVTVWAAARFFGELCVRFKQPRVVGEIIAGVLLGPTGIGDSASWVLFNDETRTVLDGLGTFSLVMYMLCVGLDLDIRKLDDGQGGVRKVIGLGVSAVVLPTVTALPVALLLAHSPGFEGNSSGNGAFFLAVAASLSVSAMPVMALILEERGMTDTPNGRCGIGAATVVTVLQFTILAVAESRAGSAASPWMLLIKLASFPALCGACCLVQAIWIAKCEPNSELRNGFSPNVCILAYGGAFLSAITTDWCGFTPLLGPFIFGVLAVPPAKVSLRIHLKEPIHRVTSWLLLPLFFVVSGLKTNLRNLEANQMLGVFLMIFSGVASKMAVAFIGTRTLSMQWNEAGLLASLLNCRGLLVLVVNLRADGLGIIGSAMFTANVLMALVSTVMVGPLVTFFLKERPDQKSRLSSLSAPGVAQSTAIDEKLNKIDF